MIRTISRSVDKRALSSAWLLFACFSFISLISLSRARFVLQHFITITNDIEADELHNAQTIHNTQRRPRQRQTATAATRNAIKQNWICHMQLVKWAIVQLYTPKLGCTFLFNAAAQIEFDAGAIVVAATRCFCVISTICRDI